MFEKRIISVFCCLCLSLDMSVQAQSVAEAGKLLADKEYVAAGEMYYRLYQFDKAVEAYTAQSDLWLTGEKAEKGKKGKQGKPEVKPNPAAAEAIAPLIQQAERAARMLSRCEDVQIIDSVIVDKAAFLNAYLMGSESGSLAPHGDASVFENSLHDKRFFAEKNAKNVYRIFSETKLQGQWLDKKELDLGSEATVNDNFPFVLADGLTMYFASTDENSIGGYDLFLTRYNLNNESYLAPSQLSMPFNSIYNDYMLAVDEINQIGYFASDRFQPKGKIIIYTFIPNEDFVAIENVSKEKLVQRAQITSIRNTWRPTIDYSDYVATLKKAIAAEKKGTKHDFSFVINDNRVYNSPDDFQNSDALQAFLKAQDIAEDRTDLEINLEGLRKEYAQASVSKKKQLRPKILSAEEKLAELATQYAKTVKEVRKLELKIKN